METSMLIMLGILTFGFITHGVIYGLQILHTPTEPGWTWSSVGTGTLCFVIAQGFYCTILQLFNQFTLINVTLALTAGFAVYAAPMAICQILKYRDSKRIAKEIRDKHDFNKQ